MEPHNCLFPQLIQANLTSVSADKPQGRSGQVHQCQTCGASFSSVFHLRRHTHIHTGARPFACKYCPQRFRHKTSLKVHVRKHTGEMPYACTECQKQFRDPANFKVHVRSHSKEKTYECNHCEKRFNSASTLYAHKKTHDADRPFSCDHCERAFRFNTTLVRYGFLLLCVLTEFSFTSDACDPLWISCFKSDPFHWHMSQEDESEGRTSDSGIRLGRFERFPH